MWASLERGQKHGENKRRETNQCLDFLPTLVLNTACPSLVMPQREVLTRSEVDTSLPCSCLFVVALRVASNV